MVLTAFNLLIFGIGAVLVRFQTPSSLLPQHNTDSQYSAEWASGSPEKPSTTTRAVPVSHARLVTNTASSCFTSSVAMFD